MNKAPILRFLAVHQLLRDKSVLRSPRVDSSMSNKVALEILDASCGIAHQVNHVQKQTWWMVTDGTEKLHKRTSYSRLSNLHPGGLRCVRPSHFDFISAIYPAPEACTARS